MFTKDQYSAHCSSSLCLKPYHEHYLLPRLSLTLIRFVSMTFSKQQSGINLLPLQNFMCGICLSKLPICISWAQSLLPKKWWESVHQGSVLSPLLFIIVLEALSREFRSGVPWEDLYADDLVIIAESLEECVRRLLTWKEAIEKKGLRVNAGKTKIMICGTGLDLLQSSGEFPCAVCRTGVGSNSIFCNGCKHWVHKKCSGLKRLKKDPDYRCTRCQGIARPLDGRPQKEVQVGPDKLEVVASFCYLGDMLSAAGGCELSTTTRVKTVWKKFKDLLPVLSTPPLFQNTWPCVQLLCAECNAPCQRDLAIDKSEPPASAAK